jgi:glycosyltransferase involved in cell wall biosynthesis
MKSVTICITSFQSGDAVALCIESVRKFTAYPHEIAVIDDASDPVLYAGDLDYLRSCRDKGWIRLIENETRRNHGPSLSRLLDTVTTDLAMVIDCDVQILSGGWLEAMVAEQERTGAAMVANLEAFPDDNTAMQSWFFMLDMAQYPHVKDDWDYTYRTDGKDGMRATGYKVMEHIWAQGRIIAPLPAELGGRPPAMDKGASFGHAGRWRHYCHVSVLSAPQSGPNWDVRRARYAVIQSELAKLRAGA